MPRNRCRHDRIFPSKRCPFPDCDSQHSPRGQPDAWKAHAAASRNALFTGLTLFLIDDGNLLDRVNVDRVKRTCALTGAQAQTSILTGLRAVVDQRSCNTVGHALIVSLRLAVIAIALAGHGCHHTDGSTDRNAHDFAHFCRTRRTAHSAGADLGLAIGQPAAA